MKKYQYLDKFGTFHLEHPEKTSYLYFPIANESGIMSSLTPTLGGDSKTSQNTFLMEPVSSENLHNNKSTRNFWLSLEGKGAWSVTGVSAKQQANLFSDQKEETSLEAGLMWHKLTRTSLEYGITATVTSFVPCTKEQVELMMVTVTNTSSSSQTLTPTAAIPMYGRSADNIRDHRHVTSLLHRTKTLQTGVVINPTLTFDERGHQKNTVVYGVFGQEDNGNKPVGFYPVVEDYIGCGGSLECPEAIMTTNVDYVESGFEVNGCETLGGIRFATVSLNPGEEKSYVIALSYGTEEAELEKMINPFLTKAAFEQSLEQTKAYWIEKNNVTYQSGNEDFDNWMYWVNFQPMLRRIYGCSFLPHHDYGKGGRGWRDLWQDCLALLIMNPDGVRSMLLDNFGGVRMDGTNATIIGTKQGEFIADRNNITRVWMDHGSWPLLTTNLYIQQTGDLDLLLERNYYFKDMQSVRGEEKDTSYHPESGTHVRTETMQDYQGTILEHLLVQHLTAFYDVGDHGHIRLRGADWNDALDMAKDRGESVAFTALYGSNLHDLALLLKHLDAKGTKSVTIAKEIAMLLSTDCSLYDDSKAKQQLLTDYCHQVMKGVSGELYEISCLDLATDLENKSNWIKNHIRNTEWLTNKDGYSWFNGYYDNSGRKVEGDHQAGVRMMLTGQVFAIMSNTADDSQVKDIIRACDQYLFDESVGGYKLNTDFREIKTDLGRMFGFAYGHKENGAVFSHMAVMYANSLYQRGFAKEGYKVISTLYNHCKDYEKSKIYPGIPEYISNKGVGLYHYLTGSASWLLLTAINQMYGIQGKLGNLTFTPKLVSEQFDDGGKASIQFVFAGKSLQVVYENTARKDAGSYEVTAITLNGEPKEITGISREEILSLSDNNTHEIIVTLA